MINNFCRNFIENALSEKTKKSIPQEPRNVHFTCVRIKPSKEKTEKKRRKNYEEKNHLKCRTYSGHNPVITVTRSVRAF